MNTTSLLQIATRMQALIEPWLDEPIDPQRLLDDPAEAREVICVCLASNQPELMALAREFVALNRPMPRPGGLVANPLHAATRPSRPACHDAAPRAASLTWLCRPKWLRRGGRAEVAATTATQAGANRLQPALRR